MESPRTYAAFAGERLIARGELESLLAETKHKLERGRADALLIFEDQTGRQVEFDFTGSLSEVLARELPAPEPVGPGRPKLGVTSREVTLLPRHWTWLQ